MTVNFKKLLAVFALSSVVCYAPNALADDDWDDDDYRPRHSQTQAKQHRKNTHANRYISRQKAGQIAKSRVKGSSVRSIDFDRNDDGRGAVYEVELNSPRGQYDVKINAKTGAVISVRRDN